MKLLTRLNTGLILAIFSSQLMAQIEVTAVAEVEVSQTNELGEKTVKRTAATSVVPGTEVIYTITAKNTGTEVADNIVVTNPVPKHTVYVDGSAFGPDAVITFSADGGKTYDSARKLMVTGTDGKPRPATAADYSHVRWILQFNLNPGQEADVWYRARVK
jgi:uncharacterized repeat protein (TIGR01451 family)